MCLGALRSDRPAHTRGSEGPSERGWAETITGATHLKANMGAGKTVWRIKAANERLSFLRYQPGHHFKPHCDALYARPGKDERSFLTCHMYLSQ